MKTSIFTEGSGTTTVDPNSPKAKDYFAGVFKPVKTLENRLSEYSETELHILSDELGYLRGETPIESIRDGRNHTVRGEEQFRGAILSAASESDVIVVLLSSNIFRDTIGEIWEELVENARGDSIWFYGAAATALDSVDIAQLESRVEDVVVYQRVGVAPIGKEAQEELLRVVEQRQTMEGC